MSEVFVSTDGRRACRRGAIGSDGRHASRQSKTNCLCVYVCLGVRVCRCVSVRACVHVCTRVFARVSQCA